MCKLISSILACILVLGTCKIGLSEYDAWRGPGCWETMGLKGIPESNHKYDDIIIIGDVHGTKAGLMMLLKATGVVSGDECSWKASSRSVLMVQMGDVVDRGKFSMECYKCLQILQQTAVEYSSKVVRLIGNHELLWLSGETNYRNKESDTPEKIHQLTKMIVSDILSGDVQGAYDMDFFRHIPMLLTHAGLRLKMRTYIESESTAALYTQQSSSNASRIASYINNKLRNDISECQREIHNFEEYNGPINCRRYLTDKIYAAGPERGGSDIGGTFWTDFSVLVKEATLTNWDFMQIVGHSIKVGEIRSAGSLNSVCVDAGMMAGGRAYLWLSNTDGTILAREWKKSIGVWGSTDMTRAYCGNYLFES